MPAVLFGIIGASLFVYSGRFSGFPYYSLLALGVFFNYVSLSAALEGGLRLEADDFE